MVNPQGTSFIPQRPTHKKVAPRTVRKIYVLAYLSYVLFFGSLIAAGGVLFMNFSLDQQIKQKQQALATEKELFNEADIESVRDLEKRIAMAYERLNQHVSVLAILEALERSAVQSLRFESFEYMREGDSFPKVVFAGSSEDFNSILFQRDEISDNPVLAGSFFNEVGVEVQELENGETVKTVKFALEKEIDPSLISYTPRTEIQEVGGEVSGENSDQTQEATSEIIVEEVTVESQ